MTLEQLRIFIAVAEREHVTEAARALHLTQSATSAAIAALEERHATKLFDRIGRRIVLTAAGQAFLAEAKSVLARAADAEALLADLAGLKAGRLALAASQTIGNYWLAGPIHRFHQHFPGISVSLTIANTEVVAQQVIDGIADLGLVEGEVADPALIIEPVGEDELVLVVRPDHPWVAAPPVFPAAFAEAKWVVREAGSGTRSVFESMLALDGIAPETLHVTLEMPTNESVRSAVEVGAGVAVLSRLVAVRAIESGRLKALDAGLPKRPFLALRHRERYHTRAAAEFLAGLSAPG
ncbi:MAG: LysR family transcriptional regulator [Ancalomicrobiaceae bacterium]|nr:LysR family transcriptional regulator [Ancalomicrobiaceae bacterium]